MCSITRTAPSFLLHPLDFLDKGQVPELAFFPGMGVAQERKIEYFRKIIINIQKWFCTVNMSSHAKYLISQNKLKIRY